MVTRRRLRGRRYGGAPGIGTHLSSGDRMRAMDPREVVELGKRRGQGRFVAAAMERV